MMRSAGAAILGYFVIFVTVFATFSVSYLILGPDRTFQPGVYEVSTGWVVISLVLSFGAAVLGGVTTRSVDRDGPGVVWLAVLVAVLGLVMAYSAWTAETAELARAADVGNLEAMRNARPPSWLALLNPVVGVLGVLAGGRWLRRQA
jgi:hypothetical protein